MRKTINIIGLTLGAGGAEKVISLLLTKLIDDFNVNLILFHDVRHFEIPEAVSVYILDESNKNSFLCKRTSPIKLIKSYKKILIKTNPDISISFLTRPNFLNTFTKLSDSKIIISERCYPSVAYRSSFFRYSLYKVLIPILYNKADIVFSNSKYINKDLKTNFKVKAPLEVIYNPIEDADEKIFLDKDEKNIDIIWVGKLVDIKNPSLLIEALHNTERQYKTILLGEGNLLRYLKNKINGLEITFKGKVSNVYDYLKKSKVLILTSNSEGFPNVILEGMSYGLPVIATNCKSGPLELLNDGVEVDIPIGEYKVVKYGILINVDDSEALSLSIDRVFNDLELYNCLSNKSLQRVKDYSVDKIYSQLKSLF